MYAGQKVEQATAARLFVRPRHPYTEALLSSMPQSTPIGSPLPVIPGVVPRPEDFPATCRFRDRCNHAVDACATTVVDAAAHPGAGRGRRTAEAGWARCLRQDELHLTGAAATVRRAVPRSAPYRSARDAPGSALGPVRARTWPSGSPPGRGFSSG